MTTMKASDLIDATVKARLAATLKADGFKRSARTFQLTREAVIQVLNVQASQSNLGDEGSFTLNLGVYVPDLGRVLGEAVQEKPKEYQCQARQRIGRLMAGGEDHWWDVSPRTDLAALAEEIDLRYRELARPWFEALATPRALETSPACLGGDLARAGLALVEGRREDAARYIEPILAHPDSYAVGYVSDVRQFAKRHGLVDLV